MHLANPELRAVRIQGVDAFGCPSQRSLASAPLLRVSIEGGRVVGTKLERGRASTASVA